MNKSLLAVMAIMPTLLVGCKKETLKVIDFEGVGEITFTSESDIHKEDLVTKPAMDNLDFTYKGEIENWEDYVKVEYTSSGVKDTYTFTFSSKSKYESVKGFSLLVCCGNISTPIGLTWNY